MGGLRLTVLAVVVAAFLIAPTALLADEQSALTTGVETAPDDPSAQATITTTETVEEEDAAGTTTSDAEEGEADDLEATETTGVDIDVSRNEIGDDEAQPVASASATTAVSIGDFFYKPQDVTIDVGDTVDWTNDGTVPEGHTATGDGFDSGVLKEGDTYAHTFTTAGSFDYVCTLHPNMRGTVTVTGSTTAGDDSAAAEESGEDSGTGAVPSAGSSSGESSGTGDSSGSLASTGLNLILLGEIGGCLLATGLLIRRLRYGWPF